MFEKFILDMFAAEGMDRNRIHNMNRALSELGPENCRKNLGRVTKLANYYNIHGENSYHKKN